MFLQSLRAKFQWVINQEKKLGLPPPPALATFGMTAEDKKRKRTKILEEVFVNENVVVDECTGTWFLPQGLKAEKGLSSAESWIFYYNGNWDLVMLGLFECKALESNVRRIRVKDIVKKVEDYLKAYSSVGIDVSWYVKEYAEVLRRVRGGNTLTILLPFEEE
ncbi:hypothetical protein Tco_1364391 [Tanacetum coccineum]